MTDVEEWRPVVGFEGAYEVSSLGRVRSLDRIVIDGRGIPRRYRGRVRNLQRLAGYVGCTLSADGYSQGMYVHHMVAAAFRGPRPAGQVVRHLNDDPTDNRQENIAYGTRWDNAADARINGGQKFAEQHHNCKHSEELITQVISARKRMSSSEAGLEFGLPSRYVRGIWSGDVRSKG